MLLFVFISREYARPSILYVYMHINSYIQVPVCNVAIITKISLLLVFKAKLLSFIVYT